MLSILILAAFAGVHSQAILPAFAAQQEGPVPASPRSLDFKNKARAKARLRALRTRDRIRAAGKTAYPNEAWRLIGPVSETANGPTGQLPSSAGRVTALAVNPANSQIVYAGAAEGGVWKTVNGGQTWQPMTDSQVSLSTGAIALDPSNPNTVWVATGEADNAIDSYPGVGVLKSTDAGQTWSLYGESDLAGNIFGAIAVNPVDSNELLVAGFDGIYQSTDGGNTWLNTLTAQQASAVVFDLHNPGVAWAGVANPVSDDSAEGIYKSTDGGSTWTKINNPAFPTSNIGRISIALAPSNSQIIYAGISGTGTASATTYGVIVSQDGGNTWIATTGATYGGSAYDNTLAVSPLNPAFVVGGGQNISFSSDAGKTWAPAAFADVHVDQHAAAFSADGTVLYVANDGGVYSAQLTSATPALIFQSTNATFSITQFFPGFSINPANPTYAIGGTQGNNIQLYTGSTKWNSAACGDGFATGGGTYTNPINPNYVFVTCEQEGLEFSSDGGAAGSFVPVMSGLPASEIPLVGVVVGDPTDANTVYWAGNTGLWKLQNATLSGYTWSEISSALGSLSPTTAIGVSPDGTALIFSDGSNVFCSTSAQTAAPAFADCTPALTNSPSISGITFDPANPGSAWVTTGGFASGSGNGFGQILYYSAPANSWSDVTGDFVAAPVSQLLDDPATGTLYIATDVGVFSSSNGGANWVPVGSGLPNVVVSGVQLIPAQRILRASTHGRSMWDLPVPLSAPTVSSASIVSSADYGNAGSAGLVPGSIAAIFGVQLAPAAASATSIPLPLTLQNASAAFNQTAAPLFYVSPAQMNVQIPWETPLGQVTALVNNGSLTSSATPTVSAYGPGIYTINASGGGQGAITNLDGSLAANTGTPGYTSHPAQPGTYIVIYCTGLGPVTNQPATGAASQGSPLAETTSQPIVSVGGATASIEFSGLAPGFVGLYQINALLPQNTPSGSQISLQVTIGGVRSNTVTIAVQSP